MENQNSDNNEIPNYSRLWDGKGLNSKDATEISILTMFILIITLLTFQLTSYIFNIDFLAPFPGFNFIITPICLLLTFIVMFFLKKSNYIFKILIPINKLISWIEKHPFIYKSLRFSFKHPIVSAFLIWIVWILIRAF